MGGYAHRRSVHYGTLIHYDYVGVRQIFPPLSLYRNRSRSSIHFCGRAAVDPNAAAVSMVWSYIGELIFNMLVLVGAVKMADRVVREMMGL